MRVELNDSWHAFLAVGASSLYRSSNAVVLGFMAGPTAVAYYSLAEKLVKAVQEICRPVTQATYPRICALFATQKLEALLLLRKLLLGIGILNITTSLGLYFFAGEIIHLISGYKMDSAIIVLQYMSPIPLIGGINSILGVQTMHPFGYTKAFSKFVLSAGLINITLIIPFVFYYSAQGAGLCYLASELFLLTKLLVFHKKMKINLFKAVKREPQHAN
jgi:O-antigen/teichoic acid export membrane protein